MIGIYKITNLVNGKVYIGQSVDINRRIKRHKSRAFNINSNGYGYPLYKAIRKYGIDNFSFEVLEECAKDELNEKEIYYITKYDSWKNGYNQNEGGNSVTHNMKLTEDDVSAIILRLKTTRDNTKTIANDFNVAPRTIQSINTGDTYHRDVEKYPIRPHLNKLIDAKDGGYKKREYKDKCIVCGKDISRGHTYCTKCAPRSNEFLKRKISVKNRPEPLELAKLVKENGFSKTGKLFGVTDSAIKKWCKDYEIPHRKKELIAWYNEKMGIKTLPKKKQEDFRKPVKQIDINTGAVINVFKSICEAGRFLGKPNNQHIGEACRGTIKSAYGYHWEYA